MSIKRTINSCAIWTLALLLCSAVLGEVGLRWAGVTDFPVYQTDEVTSYIPAPEQSGAYLNKNRWLVNERSMGSGPWEPKVQRDLLLLGDSLVWGGNPLDQADKLGPRLQAAVGDRWRVWSASAGSWSVLNELAYLDRFPDVQAETDVMVWVINTGDLASKPSQWSSDDSHPRSHPQSALIYAVGKYVAPRLGFGAEVPPSTVKNASAISAETAELLKSRLSQLATNKRILIVLYPDKTELGSATTHHQTFKSVLESLLGGCCTLLELREQNDWQASLYRDDIHPSAPGNEVFARLIFKTLDQL